MLTDEELAKVSTLYAQRFEEINVKYIEMMGTHLKEIGELTPYDDVHRLQQMTKAGGNINEINKLLAEESQRTVKELSAMYEEMLKSDYKYAKDLYLYKKGIQLPLKLNKGLQAHLLAMKRLTANTFSNLSHTTVISKAYRDLVDVSVQAVASGATDYNSIIRKAIKKNPVGARVKYASGRTRRLDSAVSMNVMQGIRQMNIGTRRIMGEQFGGDGVEISAHALCAPDHIDIQGRIFTLEDFEILDASLDRPIGELNCKHYTTPVIIGISKPANSEEQLAEYRNNSEQQVIINNRTYTKYQCSQLQRQCETQMRYCKDKVVFARAFGDKEMEKAEEAKLKRLQAKYREISSSAGLSTKYNRAYVKGYRK